MKTKAVRSIAVATVMSAALLHTGCGSRSGGGGSSGGGNKPQPIDFTTPGKDPISCANSWQQYISLNPAGLKLSYEIRGLGFESTYTSEILESNDARVTIRSTTAGAGHENTTTREEFLETCQKGVPGNEDDSDDANDDTQPDLVIEERRKEPKTVRAGTFSTDYLRLRQNRLGGQNDRTLVSEMWTSTDASRFLVFQHNLTTNGTESYETTTELVDIRRP